MLPDQQKTAFDELGFVRVNGAFSAANAAAMCDRVWDLLGSHHGIQRDARDTWTVAQPAHLGRLTRCGAFNAVGSPRLCATIDNVLGTGAWPRPRSWGAPLVTFPQRDTEWRLPHAQWHMDFPAGGAAGARLDLKIFAFMAPVLPRGGGTLILAGSHRLVARLIDAAVVGTTWHSPLVRQLMMQTDPWLRALMSKDESTDRRRRCTRFMDEGTQANGISLRVVELTGNAGDAVLVHPWIFHTVAPNCSTTPRLMVSGSIVSML